MAQLDTKWPTLLDVSRRQDPNGKIAAVAELLNETNEILDDMPWLEGNLPTGHKTTVRTGLPTATWRLLNYGAQPDKSTSAQITDTCGMLEAYAEIDKALADLNGNTAAWRTSEDRPFLESMNQELAKTLIYGNTDVNPERFTGLAPRYAASGTDPKLSTYNVIKAGGTGSDNTSIYLVVWGPNTVFGIYPKGAPAGLQHTDKGQVTLEDANKGKYEGYRTHYKWDCGLTVRDWRYVVRIASIDVSDLRTAGDATDTSANIIKHMIEAIERIPTLGMGRPVFYMNRTVRSMLRVKVQNASKVLDMEDITGANGVTRKVLTFQGIPCRAIDQIINTEAAVS